MLFYYSFNDLQAQNHRREDSFLTELSKKLSDSDKVKILLKFASILETRNTDSALLLCKQAVSISRSASYKIGLISSLNATGTYYSLKGDEATAMAMEDSALSLSYKYDIRSKLASIFNIIGNIYSDQNLYDSGLAYYYRALAIDSVSNMQAWVQVCNNIGVNYQEMGSYLKAEEFFLKALKIDEETNNREGIATVNNNLANIYELEGDPRRALASNLRTLQIDSTLDNPETLVIDYENIGERYLAMDDYKTAMEYTFRGILLGKKVGAISEIYSGLTNVGQLFFNVYFNDTALQAFTYKMGDKTLTVKRQALLDSAILYENYCLEYAGKANSGSSIIQAYRGLGQIYRLKKEYEKAISYFQKAFDMSGALHLLEQRMATAQMLGHTYLLLNNYRMATRFLDITLNMKDSVFNIQRTKQFNELEAKYQGERKEKEIEALAQKNEIKDLQIKQNKYFIFGLASLALLILAITFLLFRQYRINTSHARIELEQKLLRSQMNPHFIFNAMTSIQNFIYKEDAQTASNYLSSVFKLMRSIIESSKEEYIVLEKEIASLNHYLILQQLCFQNKFGFSITVDPKIDMENTRIPPMMAQPIIENAIEHGIINKQSGKGMIDIRLTLQNDSFLFEVEDNGVGREKARELNRQSMGKHLSIATNITNERIELLNKKSKKKITLQITDLKNDKNDPIGTRVTFSFPLNKIV